MIVLIGLAGIVLPIQAELNSFTPGKTFRDCADCPEIVVIPPGSFEMGSDKGEDNEKPLHRVTIKSPFAMGKTEVTQGQWRAVMGENPSYFNNCGENCPVEQVSWEDTQKYIKRLNTKTGKKYRLPSEAEWEYACRAGGRYEYCGSDTVGNVAWYGANSNPPGNSKKIINPVALKQANAFGLYDMSGNVWEWVEDCYHDNYVGAPVDGSVWQGSCTMRILRGGAWDDEREFSRVAMRYRKGSFFKQNYDGFRLLRVLQ
jgi:formylglycine-generating enzyme required for sulfatase activity